MNVYKYLRNHTEINPKSRNHRLFIYDDMVFTKFADTAEEKQAQAQNILYQKNPFKEVFQPEKIWYGEAVTPFNTMSKKHNAQKMICNIEYGESESVKLGTMGISLLDPLFLRHIYLNSYMTSDAERYSDLDLYNLENGYGKYYTFDYERISQLELAPGDCIYVPNNWWTQIHFRMQEKIPGSSDSVFDDKDPTEEFETNIKWIEYEYSSISRLEDEAFAGLEEVRS